MTSPDTTHQSENTRPFPSWRNIEKAMETIDPAFLNSPITNSAALDAVLGCTLVAKVETINPIRSFKGRGASFFVQTAVAEDGRMLVCSSAGNFGQGLAHAAAAAGRSLTVFAAENANPDKVASMRRLGATVTLDGQDFDAAKVAAIRFAEETGGYMIVDGDEPAIAEGAGTLALEMLQQWAGDPFDFMLASLGGGALATGVGAWFKHASPETRVVAVGAKGAPAMAQSWRAGELLETESVNTIADGIAIRVPDMYALESMRETIDEVIEVDEDALVDAMRLTHRYLGLVVEPSGVAGIAAILSDPSRWAGQVVGTVLCGANINRARAQDWLHDQTT